jgi:hypothetical protein
VAAESDGAEELAMGLFAWFRRNVIADVPATQAACLSCEWNKATRCDYWDTCEARLKEASAIGAVGGIKVRSGKLKVRP